MVKKRSERILVDLVLSVAKCIFTINSYCIVLYQSNLRRFSIVKLYGPSRESSRLLTHRFLQDFAF